MSILKQCLGLVLYVAMASVFTACDQHADLREQYNTLFTEVIALHDEIMPKMNELSKLQEELSITDSDSTAIDEKRQEAILKLKKADDNMMMWMHNFTDTYVKDRKPVAKMTQDELQTAIDGLEAELKKVNELKDFTNQSITQAQNLIQ